MSIIHTQPTATTLNGIWHYDNTGTSHTRVDPTPVGKGAYEQVVSPVWFLNWISFGCYELNGLDLALTYMLFKVLVDPGAFLHSAPSLGFFFTKLTLRFCILGRMIRTCGPPFSRMWADRGSGTICPPQRFGRKRPHYTWVPGVMSRWLNSCNRLLYNVLICWIDSNCSACMGPNCRASVPYARVNANNQAIKNPCLIGEWTTTPQRWSHRTRYFFCLDLP